MPSAQKRDTPIKKGLAPIYLISGDEPLLVQEARNKIIETAFAEGFTEKETIHVDNAFHASNCMTLIQNHSLFSEKKIIDLRNANAKFDSSVLDFFQTYFLNPMDDRLILISTDKLAPAQQKSLLLEIVKKHGVHLSVWPIAPRELPQWIMERAKQRAVTIPPEIAKMLAHFTEGHLLATQQVIEKLELMYPHTTISREQLISVLSDHARFNIFDLSESIAQNDAKKVLRIMARLEQSDEELTLVLWAICRKLREPHQRIPSSVIKEGLQRAATIDLMIKGAKMGDPWHALKQLCLFLCGHAFSGSHDYE